MSISTKFIEKTNPFGTYVDIPLNAIESLELSYSKEFSQKLAKLNTMMREMNQLQDNYAIFDVAMKYACMIISSNRASIALISEDKTFFTVISQQGLSIQEPNNFTLPAEKTYIGYSYAKDSILYRKNLAITNCPTEKKLFAAGLRSTLIAPIISGGVRFGTLNTGSTQEAGYNEDDIYIFSQLIMILEKYLNNLYLREKINKQNQILISQNEELKSFAYHDPLTKIYNRRYTNAVLKNEILKSSACLSIIMLDIDNFKTINDDLGHDYGDQVLCEVTRLTLNSIRSNDVFCRWGGEEFLIVCCQTKLLNAYNLAERIRLTYVNNKSEVLDKVTASFGVAQLNTDDTLNTLLKRADNALYNSKKSGKNCCTMLE